MEQYPYLHYGRATDVSDKGNRRLYRILEILPGVLAWLTLLFIIVFSFIIPFWMALFIIAFDIYWLIKTVYLSLHLRVAYRKLRENQKVAWLEKLEQLPVSQYTLPNLESWKDINHFIFLPLYKEGFEVVSASIDSLLKANYPKEKMAVILCWEERAGDETRQTVEAIEKVYKDKFWIFLSVMHPSGLPNEIPGKGSNTAYAAKVVKEQIIDRLGLDGDKIIVSNFDIDTVAYPEYFGALTHTFLTTPSPLRTSYQPVPLYVNNIWTAPLFARVVAFSATFWHTIKQERPDSATTFSSHSMPWRALEDVGYWQKNMVSEDSRIFWQCLLRYDGDYKVASLYYPVSMDANVAEGNWQTIKNIYKQQRRWAYGVENVPYFIYGFIKNKKISLGKKWYYGFIVGEGNHSWATNAIMLFLLGWLPVIVGGPEFNHTVLSFNLPYLTRAIMTLSMVGLVSSAVMSMILLPPRPPEYGRWKHAMMVVQWIVFPITTIALGSIPALDAQTKLSLGKYMGFWVTPKARVSK